MGRAPERPPNEEAMEETLTWELAERVDRYIEGLFVPAEPALEQALEAAQKAGLPEIQVSANEGKLLYLIAKMVKARRVLEIGTLGGYSTTWLARAVPADGKVVSLELEHRHAEVARANLEQAGVGRRVDLRVGPAAATLERMIDLGEPPFDLVFIDADKEGYGEYLTLSLRLTRPGSVILADNVIRRGLVLDPDSADTRARAAREYNQAIAAHPGLESLVLPIIREHLDGLAISIVR
jgi:caffeoyl-CoA O-methyltransferase